MKTVVVGMSGGVDSSVAALLLKEQGYRVIGLFMKNWEEEGECPSHLDHEDVASVCTHLEIPYYTVNFSKEYWDHVFSQCLKGYAAGHTPNPDILCNREIKFNVFLKKAFELGANYLATGHYCQKLLLKDQWHLLRAKDLEKDQSYFLYTLKSSILEKVLFPIGKMRKKQVRVLAQEAGLTTALKKDSTGICFIGKQNFKKFLSRFIPNQLGNFERCNGQIVGHHEGIAYYTVGQRRGLNIGGPGEPWYVVGKDATRNVVLVEQGEDHPQLYRSQLSMHEVSWVAHLPKYPLRCTAKIRYRTADVPCTVVTPNQVIFDQFQKAVTPQQSVVFYQDQVCLGGGIIA